MMAFSSFSEFLQMGTHAAYVWSAVSIVISTIVLSHILVHIQHKRLKKQLKLLQQSSIELS